MKVKQISLYFILLLLITACNEDFDYSHEEPDKDQITAYLTVSAPSMRIPQKTRSGNVELEHETNIEEIVVLVLENTGDGFRYKYRTNGRSLSKGDEFYIFNALLSASDNPLKLYILANSKSYLNNISPEETEENIKKKINRAFTEEGIYTDFPMFGEVSLPNGITEEGETFRTALVRSIARVDVVNFAENFELTSVQLYRANNQIQIIPEALDDDKVTSPSIPDGAAAIINTPAQIVNGSSLMGGIYLPESAITPESNRREGATCVVIGGIYRGDTTPTYYRMDFVPDNKPELSGQVLRNHRYVFQIEKVLGPGWREPGEASTHDSSQAEVIIKEWNSDTMHMVFDGYHYLGVSTRHVHLDYHEGFSSTVEVDTDLDSYKVYWLNDNNERDPLGSEMNWGDTSVSPDGLFSMDVSPNGRTIKITSQIENQDPDPFTGSFRIEAGRMHVQVWIEQDIARSGARHIYLFSARVEEIGGFGSQILGVTQEARERTKHFVSKLNNKENFGPMGTIHFDGFLFGGRTDAEIPVTTANLFDVLHFPYPAEPSKTTAKTVYNWVKSSKNRVLIFHYDNTNLNAHLKTEFGLTTTQYKFSSVSPEEISAHLHPEAPEMIVNGPFGKVAEDMKMRIYDTTIGLITMEEAARHNITPVLVTQAEGNNPAGVVLGIDFKNQIVYCGDIDFYSKHLSTSHTGEAISESNAIEGNNADILMANLFAWIAKTVLAY
ncbi:MAG: hypothetical protein LUG98_04215 [Tannerellaceae bacterium]|nr:hypothetical protein [Tannerellaceae bacterium]